METPQALKSLVEEFGPVISSYTRAQALADGVIVDAGEMAREAGFKIPVAISRALWTDAVEWTEEDAKLYGGLQDQTGRLWDVLWMAGIAARSVAPDSDDSLVFFWIHRVKKGRKNAGATKLQIKMELHGDDDGKPVITLMLPGED